MTIKIRYLSRGCMSLLWLFAAICMVPVYAQSTFTQQKLDQLLAPLALYPDALLGQVLIAATYPLEVTQAATYLQLHHDVRSNQLDQMANDQQWDVSIRSLLPFPSVLLMMNQNLSWTQQLGDAFLAQQQAVMETVQSLRNKARLTGHLITDQQQRVIDDNGDITIEPVNMEVYYVPYYNPGVVYGTWWWPDSRPIYWQPPTDYRSSSYGGDIANGIAFGIGVGIVGSLFLDVRPDWHTHHIMIVDRGHLGQSADGNQWQHNPQHRQGVAYRNQDIRNQFSPAAIVPTNRENFRGRSPNAVIPASQRPSDIREKVTEHDHPKASIPPQYSPSAARFETHTVHQSPSAPVNSSPTFSHPMMPSGPRQEVQVYTERGQQSRASMSHGDNEKRTK